MEIKLCIDEYSGEPYLMCQYTPSSTKANEVLALFETMLREKKLCYGSPGRSPKGDRWFTIEFEEGEEGDEDE